MRHFLGYGANYAVRRVGYGLRTAFTGRKFADGNAHTAYKNSPNEAAAYKNADGMFDEFTKKWDGALPK